MPSSPLDQAVEQRLRRTIEHLADGLDLVPPRIGVGRLGPLGLAVAVNGRPVAVDSEAGPLAAANVEPSVALDAVDRLGRRLLGRLGVLLEQPPERRSVRHYVTGLGATAGDPPLSSPTWQQFVGDIETAMGEAERPLVVRAPARVVRAVSDDAADLATEMRKDYFLRTGVQLPDLVIQLAADDAPDLEIVLNQSLVRSRIPDGADWAWAVAEVRRACEHRAHWFVRRSDGERALDDLWYLLPDLVEWCRECYDAATVTTTLRELLRGGHSVRNLSRIIWLLLDLGTAESGPDTLLLADRPLLASAGPASGQPSHDPYALASRLRKCIVEEAWRVGTLDPPGTSARLEPDTEAALQSTEPEVLALAEWQAVGQYHRLGRPQLVVVRTVAAIPPVWDVLQAVSPSPRVIASAELPPDADLAALPVASAFPAVFEPWSTP